MGILDSEEKRLLALLRSGMDLEQARRKLKITQTEAKRRIRHIHAKFNVKSDEAAVACAIRKRELIVSKSGGFTPDLDYFEVEVLRAIADDKSCQQVAKRHRTSPYKVQVWVGSAMAKLRAQTLTQAISEAFEHRLLK